MRVKIFSTLVDYLFKGVIFLETVPGYIFSSVSNTRITQEIFRPINL